MTPRAVAADAKVPDQRARSGAGSDSSAAAANQDFGGVLTDVGEQTKAIATPRSSATGTVPHSPLAATTPQAVVLTPAPDLASTGGGVIQSLVGKIIAAPTLDAKDPEPDTTDADEAPSSAKAVPAATPVSVDLLAMLTTTVANASAPSTGPSRSVDASSISVITPVEVGVPGSAEKASPGARPDAAAEPPADAPIIASVAVATQLAPVAPTAPRAVGRSAAAGAQRADASPAGAEDAEATTSFDEGERAGAPNASAAAAPVASLPSQANRPFTVAAQQPVTTSDTPQGNVRARFDGDAPGAPAATAATDLLNGNGGIPAFTLSATAPINGIAQAMADLAASAATSSPATDPVATAGGPLAPARTMVLQMSPSELGTVSVRLHLTGRTLDVQLSVSEPHTLGLISRERDALSNALADRAYQINSLVIQSHDPQASPAAGSHDPTPPSNRADANSQQGASASGDSGVGGDGAQRDAPGRDPARRSPHQGGAMPIAGASRDIGAGGLFV